jgi:hypothetical protein
LTVDCFIKYIHKNGTKFRSHPNYHNEGPWYDWASVTFGEDGATENVPCRLLLFYHQKGENNDLSDSEASQSTNDECGIRALVQTCSYQQALETPEECKEKMYDTALLSDKICMMTTRLACNRAIESSYWRMDNNSDVGLLTGYVLYRLPIELESMDLDTFSR